MVFVSACISVGGGGPRRGFISLAHVPWAPVEPNATGLPSESLYVTAERIIQETIMRPGI